MLLCSPADSLPILPLLFPCRRLEQRKLDWLQALPGRHFLSIEVLGQLLGVASENELRDRFPLAFPLGWEEPNGLMAVPLRRMGKSRRWYIPTLSTKEQNGAAVGTQVESKRPRRASLSSLSSLSSSSSPPPPPPNPWKHLRRHVPRHRRQGERRGLTAAPSRLTRITPWPTESKHAPGEQLEDVMSRKAASSFFFTIRHVPVPRKPPTALHSNFFGPFFCT